MLAFLLFLVHTCMCVSNIWNTELLICRKPCSFKLQYYLFYGSFFTTVSIGKQHLLNHPGMNAAIFSPNSLTKQLILSSYSSQQLI